MLIPYIKLEKNTTFC